MRIGRIILASVSPKKSAGWCTAVVARAICRGVNDGDGAGGCLRRVNIHARVVIERCKRAVSVSPELKHTIVVVIDEPLAGIEDVVACNPGDCAG